MTPPKLQRRTLAAAFLGLALLAGLATILIASSSPAGAVAQDECNYVTTYEAVPGSHISASRHRFLCDGTVIPLSVGIQRYQAGSWVTVAQALGQVTYNCNGTRARRYRIPFVVDEFDLACK